MVPKLRLIKITIIFSVNIILLGRRWYRFQNISRYPSTSGKCGCILRVSGIAGLLFFFPHLPFFEREGAKNELSFFVVSLFCWGETGFRWYQLQNISGFTILLFAFLISYLSGGRLLAASRPTKPSGANATL